MRLIIDGYNLIRRIPELSEADRTDPQRGRDALLRQLSSYRAGKDHRITVVFDGTDALHLGGNRGKIRGITVCYSPRGLNADRIIIDAIGRNEADVLVSADRELIDAASRGGVTPVPPEFFWGRVQEEMYRRMKGQEEELENGERKGKRGRKLSKAQRKDRGRIEKL